MLDNMDNSMMKKAVEIVHESGDTHVQLEASGNMNLDRVKEIADIGLDYISVGALTHSVKALDISMRIQ
jgi:nicotinate-nucleotide pyrophosphorylase (carboxylating)